MKYEIAYISKSGNTEKIAYGISYALPNSDTFVTNLDEEVVTGIADVNIICFGVNSGVLLPIDIMDTLDMLEGKTILFCVTAGFELDEKYIENIESIIIPFLPDVCNYEGLFVCQGQFPDEVIEMAKEKFEKEPENTYAKKVIKDSKISLNHPDENDIKNAVEFVKAHIE